MKSRSSACGIGRAYTGMRALPQAMRAEFSVFDAQSGRTLSVKRPMRAILEGFHLKYARHSLDRSPRGGINRVPPRQTQFSESPV